MGLSKNMREAVKTVQKKDPLFELVEYRGIKPGDRIKFECVVDRALGMQVVLGGKGVNFLGLTTIAGYTIAVLWSIENQQWVAVRIDDKSGNYITKKEK